LFLRVIVVEKETKINIYYFDESGFLISLNLPYYKIKKKRASSF